MRRLSRLLPIPVFAWALLLLGAASIHAQTPMDVLRKLKASIQQASTIGYDYEMFSVYNGVATETVQGRMQVTPGFVYDQNAGQTIFKNNHWYYKADHDNKTVIVADLSKIPRGTSDGAMRAQQQQAGLRVADSLLLKYATVKLLSAPGATVLKLELSFAPEVYMRSIVVEYDQQKDRLLLYKLVTERPYQIDDETEEEEYAEQTMIAKNFSYSVPSELGNADALFTEKDGRIILTKHRGYKVVSMLK